MKIDYEDAILEKVATNICVKRGGLPENFHFFIKDAIAALDAIFDWQPIETAPKTKNQPVLIYWRERVKRSGPKKHRFFVSEGMWDDGTADNEPQDFNSADASWVLPNSAGFEEPVKWLSMIPLPEVV